MPALKWPSRLDSFLRHQDFYWNRTEGGILDETARIGRHTVVGVLLTTMMCVLVVAGPSIGLRLRWIIAAVIGVVTLIANLTILRRAQLASKDIRWDARVQVGFVVTCAVLMWIATDGRSVELTGGLYRHLGIVIVPIFAVGVLVASAVAAPLFRPVAQRAGFEAALKSTELFVLRGHNTPISLGLVVRSILTAAFRAPLRLLLPPAIAVLVALPGDMSVLGITTSWARAAGVGTLVVTGALLTVAGIRRRLDEMFSLAEGPFFRGGAVLVSLFVIAIAAARLANFSYVTTLLDGAPGATILWWCASMYIVSWWYDYWTRRLVTEQLLGAFGTPAPGSCVVPYPYQVPVPPITRVPGDERRLQVHGTGRFIVMRPSDTDDFAFFFHAYEPEELFGVLSGSAAVENGAGTMRLLEQQTRTFGLWVAGVPIAVLLSLWLNAHNLPKEAEVVGRDAAITKLTAASLLFDGDACAGNRSQILFAASGGGTRAAVYTASVLDGLARIGQLERVRLVSGISGGGAALAYFVSHRPQLAALDSDAWDEYFRQMEAPYIQDVINGAGEWRVGRSTRLGKLLAESFASHWKLAEKENLLASVADPGMILNSSLAADLDKHVACEQSASCLADSIEAVDAAHKSKTSTALAPGRLIYTNLALSNDYDALPDRGLGPNHEIRLPIVVVNRPDVKLTDAAAANANFPPVFSDAAVDLDNSHRYWVSDGGVLDNRAMETLFYAVLGSINSSERKKCANLPDLHIIVADASAFSDTFQQDRAVGTAIAAGASFASQLAVELEHDLERQYQPGKVFFHYLPMPNLMRTSGAFGTHWMLQPWIKIMNGTRGENWTGRSVVAVIRAMHGDNTVALDKDTYDLLHRSLTDSDEHANLWWKDIVATLKY